MFLKVKLMNYIRRELMNYIRREFTLFYYLINFEGAINCGANFLQKGASKRRFSNDYQRSLEGASRPR